MYVGIHMCMHAYVYELLHVYFITCPSKLVSLHIRSDASTSANLIVQSKHNLSIVKKNLFMVWLRLFSSFQVKFMHEDDRNETEFQQV